MFPERPCDTGDHVPPSAVAGLVVVLSQMAPLPTDAVIIKRAKNSIVRDIESTLPRVTFEAWLHGVLGTGAAMTWEVNDCGEHPGHATVPPRDFPVCVQVQADAGGDRRLTLFLAVGTQSRLTAGPPTLVYGTLDGSRPPAETTSISKLSQVPTLLGR
jgi:hypothetical protein